MKLGEFSGSPGVRTQPFTVKGTGSIPGQELRSRKLQGEAKNFWKKKKKELGGQSRSSHSLPFSISCRPNRKRISHISIKKVTTFLSSKRRKNFSQPSNNPAFERLPQLSQ